MDYLVQPPVNKNDKLPLVPIDKQAAELRLLK